MVTPGKIVMGVASEPCFLVYPNAVPGFFDFGKKMRLPLPGLYFDKPRNLYHLDSISHL
jgi:hypothetical protein